MNNQPSSLCILIDEPESQCVVYSLKLIGYLLNNLTKNNDKKALLICTRSSWDTTIRSIGDDIISFFDSKPSDSFNADNVSYVDPNHLVYKQLKQCFGPNVVESRFSNDSYNRIKDNNLQNGHTDLDISTTTNSSNTSNNNDANTNKNKNGNNNKNKNKSNGSTKSKYNPSDHSGSSDSMKRLLIRFVDEMPTNRIVDGEQLDYSPEHSYNTFWSYILAANETSIHQDTVDYFVVAGLSEINLRSSASNFEDLNYAAGRLHPFRAVSVLEDNTRDYYNKSISMYALSLALTLNAMKSKTCTNGDDDINVTNKTNSSNGSNKSNDCNDTNNNSSNSNNAISDNDNNNSNNTHNKSNEEIKSNKSNSNKCVESSFPRFILVETLPQHNEDADKFTRFISQRFTYTYCLY